MHVCMVQNGMYAGIANARCVRLQIGRTSPAVRRFCRTVELQRHGCVKPQISVSITMKQSPKSLRMAKNVKVKRVDKVCS